jgi:signal transduction histidine kinase
MSAFGVAAVIACVGQLVLAAFALRRRASVAMAMPLAVLCVVAAVWTFAAFVYDLTGVPAWHQLDVAVSPLLLPACLAFVAAFVGRRRALRPLVVAAYVLCGALGAMSVVGTIWPPARAFEQSWAWSLSYVLAGLPVVVFAALLLARYLASGVSPAERMRTHLLLMALAGGAAFGLTELLPGLGVDVPRLGVLATLLMAGVLAAVALQAGFLEQRPTATAALHLGAVVVVASAAALALPTLFDTAAALGLAALLAVVAVLGLAIRRFAMAAAAARARREHLAFLGRLSDQMAHDLRNPVAAIMGAADLLLEERQRGRSLDPHADYVEIIASEARRLARLLDLYRRFGRIEPQRRPVDVGSLIDGLRRASWLSEAAEVEVEADTLEAIEADPDLLGVALDNVARNAIEAGAKRLRLTVHSDGGVTRFAVHDDGRGMDARTRELALEDLYTTKETGGGLGLPFARRVAEAHGGGLSIDSTPGEGTVVTLRIMTRRIATPTRLMATAEVLS